MRGEPGGRPGDGGVCAECRALRTLVCPKLGAGCSGATYAKVCACAFRVLRHTWHTLSFHDTPNAGEFRGQRDFQAKEHLMSLVSGRFFTGAALLAVSLGVPARGHAAEQAGIMARAVATQAVEFDVVLPIEHRAELEKLLDSLHDPKSAQYHKWLKPGSSTLALDRARTS